MERLTKRVGVDEAVPICDFDICVPFQRAGKCKTGTQNFPFGGWERHCNDTCILGRMIDRLAAYEDTGLTPGEVNKLDSQRKAMAALADSYKAEIPRWIPVTERLPQENEPEGATCKQVQVLLDNGVVSTGWCNRHTKLWWHLNYGETHFIGYDYEHTPVVAWQPLAQPPEEG